MMIGSSVEPIDGAVAPPARYSVVLFDPLGQVLRKKSFVADADPEAMTVARGFMDGRPVELWNGLRFIERFDPPQV